MQRSALALLLVALLVGGCGGSGSSESSSTVPKATAPNAAAGSKVVSCEVAGAGAAARLRAVAVDCDAARRTMGRWGQTRGCALAGGASRGSCTVDGFRCQAVKVDQGVTVSCARPGGDVAFVAKSPGG
jgi:hypothetical protein